MKPSALLGMSILLSAIVAPAHAVTITAVAAPNLLRPSDGFVYPFGISVSGIFDAGDIAAGAIQVVITEYWDQDGAGIFDPFFPDDPIDTTGAPFAIPAPGPADIVGSPWGPFGVSLFVGCSTDSEVIGPSGGTGEGPIMDDGYFRFLGATNPLWGYNTVTCIGSRPIELPREPLHSIGEPGTLALFSAGVLGLLGYRGRCRRKTACRTT